MMSETVKVDRKEVGIEQVKQMLDNGAKLTAELFETGYCDENEPVKEYRGVVTQSKNGEETKVVMNMLDILKVVELYRGRDV